MSKQQTKKGGGSRKHGRNMEKCKEYRARNTRAKNKERKIKKQAKMEGISYKELVNKYDRSSKKLGNNNHNRL